MNWHISSQKIKKTTHTIGETLIKPAAVSISCFKERKIFFAIRWIHWRSGLAQLLVFVSYIANEKPEEDLLMWASLLGTCTDEDIFSAVDTRLKNDGLSWEQCISICADYAGAMAGKHKGFLTKVLQAAPLINFTHCIIHRENLACKTLDPDLISVFDSAIKVVNFIKSRPLRHDYYHSLWWNGLPP